jgi:hypothetical protein
MEPRELPGKWWIPREGQKTADGILRVDPSGGLTLELSDSLLGGVTPIDRLMAGGGLREPVLQGVTGEKVEVTLLNGLVVSQSMNVARWETRQERWLAERAIVGRHFDSPDEIGLRELRLSVDGMGTWAGPPPIDVERGESPTVAWRGAQNQVAVCNGATIAVRHTPETVTNSDSATVRDNLAIDVEFPEEVSLDTMMKTYLQPLRNLASFIRDEACAVHQAICRSSSAPTVPIEVLFEQIGGRRDAIGQQPLFTLATSPVDFQTLVCRWLAIYAPEELRSVVDQFMGLAFAPPEFAEMRFMVLVQALEEYHRRRIGGTAMKPEAFKARRARIFDALASNDNVTGDDRRWLKGKFKRLNDLSLEQRLAALIRSQGDVLGPLFSNPDGFASVAADTRNSLSHGEETLQQKAAAGIQIFFLEKCLRQLLVVLLLAELGAPQKAVAELLKGNPNHQWVIDIARQSAWEDS